MKRLMVFRSGIWYSGLLASFLCVACAEPRSETTDSSTSSKAATIDVKAEQEHLERDVRRIFTATFDGDAETIIQNTHPKVIEMMGGVEEARSVVQSAVWKSKSAGITYEPVIFTRSPTFLSSSSNEFAIVLVRITAWKDGRKASNDSYQLAVRPLGTKSGNTSMVPDSQKTY